MGTGVEDGLADAAIIQLIFAETNVYTFFGMLSYVVIHGAMRAYQLID